MRLRSLLISKLKINLTKKTRSQEKVILAGYSDYNPNVDKQGDLVFIIKIKPHSKYIISGNNLHCSEVISLEEALCGFEREITLPNNIIKRYSINNVIHPKDTYSIARDPKSAKNFYFRPNFGPLKNFRTCHFGAFFFKILALEVTKGSKEVGPKCWFG